MKNRIVNNMLDLIFPRRCPICHEIVDKRGKLICEKCKTMPRCVTDPYCIKCGKPLRESSRIMCSGCSDGNIYFEQSRALFVYDDIMRDSIYRFKYGGRKEYAEYYANEIFAHFKEKIRDWNPAVIIPIPIHSSKLKKRGYNQAFLIALQLSYLTKIPVDTQILQRIKKTEIQKNLGGLERAHNLKNAFKIGSNRVQYLSAMLIDDIYTTGATINSASRVLFEGGIQRIYSICVSIGYDV